MNVLLDSKLREIRELFSGFSPPISLSKCSSSTDMKQYAKTEKLLIDLLVMELSADYKYQLKQMKELKKYNPDLKSIILTSRNNHRFRDLYLKMGFDYFIFDDSDRTVLELIIKRLHFRKTNSN